MKNQIPRLLAIGLALVVLAIPCVYAQATNALSLSDLHISPQPLIAGTNATIVFQLYNSYSSSLGDVNLQVTASNPIINVSPSSTTLIDSIGNGLYGGGSDSPASTIMCTYPSSSVQANTRLMSWQTTRLLYQGRPAVRSLRSL